MNKLFLVFAVLTLSTSLAGAADLGLRKGPPLYAPPAPPPMWNGFYLGLNAGGIWTNSHNQFITAAPAGVELGFPHNPLVGNPSIDTANFLAAFSSAASASGFNSGSNTGFIGGGQIGYNFQFQGRLIAGFEADFQGIAAGSPNHTIATVAPVAVDVNGRSTNYVGVHSVHGALDYLGTVRGRLGFLVTPSLLLYGTGGLAYGGAHLQTTSLVYNVFMPSSRPSIRRAPRTFPQLLGALTIMAPRPVGPQAAVSNGCSGRTGPQKSNIFITIWVL